MLTGETVERLIASSRPRLGLQGGFFLAMLGLAIMLGVILADPDLVFGRGSLGWLWPQIVLVMLVLLVIRLAKKQRWLAKLMVESFEAVQLRQWERARDTLIQLLQHPVKHPQARAESLLALAAVAEAGHDFDASQRVYESLLAEEAADPIQLQTARVALAAAMLRTGRTTDAVDLIDRLARMDLPGPFRAQVELLSLFREVTMGHGADNVDRAEQRRELFRKYLSTRAGYGYGLLAAAFDHANQPRRAEQFWHDATLLIRRRELIEHFQELAPIAEKYRAAEFAL